MDWYALSVETGKEDIIGKIIRKYFLPSTVQAIVPKRRLLERKESKTYEVLKIMFPGYVFIKTRMNAGIYYELKRIPMYIKLLNKFNKNEHTISYSNSEESDELSWERFSRIAEEEMALILRLIGKNEVIDYSILYLENTKVIVYNGPLKGLEGIIVKINKRKNRARVAMNFLGNEKYIDVGIELLSLDERSNYSLN